MSRTRSAFLLLLFAFCVSVGHASGLEPEEWGEPVDGVQVSVAPLRPVFRPSDPVGFQILLRNKGSEPLAFTYARRDPDTGTTWPETLQLLLTTEDGTTQIAHAYFGDPWPSGRAPGYGREPVEAELGPGGQPLLLEAYPHSIRVRSGRAIGSRRFDITTGTHHVQAQVFTSKFGPDSWRLAQVRKGLEGELLKSNTTTFTLTASDDRVTSTYQYRLRWWERATLRLYEGGRFRYEFFSDAGGQRPEVKGTWEETSESLLLRPEIYGGQPGFPPVLLKFPVDGQVGLITPEAKAHWKPGQNAGEDRIYRPVPAE